MRAEAQARAEAERAHMEETRQRIREERERKERAGGWWISMSGKVLCLIKHYSVRHVAC
jgi:hypothetical protein